MNEFKFVKYKADTKVKAGDYRLVTKRTNKRTKKLKLYIEYQYPCCLDTETSYSEDKSLGWIYHWAININNTVYRGRKVTELIDLLDKLATMLELEYKHKHLVIYVHNLSYDIVYLEHHLSKEFGIVSRLDIKSRKVLNVVCGNGIELRCSYMLTGMSLDKFSKNMHSKHVKKTGAVNHSIQRTPYTKLCIKDILYMYADITSLADSLRIKFRNDNVNTANVPLTKTGYVRNVCREEYNKNRRNRELFKRTALTLKQYRLAEKAYKGGYTHASYKYRNKLVKGNIKHFDFRSHYPSVLMLEKFPMTPFSEVRNITLESLLNTAEQIAYIVTFRISKYSLKEGRYFPLLQVNDAILTGTKKKDIINNNGRVQACITDSIYTLTGDDLKLVSEMYDYEYIELLHVEGSVKQDIPYYLKKCIKDFFLGKYKYKKGDQYLYMKSKELLNSIYGMMCTKIIRPQIDVDKTGRPVIVKMEENDAENMIKEYYKSKNNFTMYQIGVWVTAYARKWLYDYFSIIEEENILYCDTDSAFFISNDEILKRIEEKNKYWYNKAISEQAYITYKGKVVTFGAFEDEKDNIVEFKTLHAKCYVVKNKFNVLNVTIAGVCKKGRNGATIEKELGCIDNLNDGFTFIECGGTTSSYNNIEEIVIYEHKEGPIEVGNSCIITESEKQISSLKNDEILYN